MLSVLALLELVAIYVAPYLLVRVVWRRTHTTKWPQRGVYRSLALATLMPALVPLGYVQVPVPLGSKLVLGVILFFDHSNHSVGAAWASNALIWYAVSAILFFAIASILHRRKRIASPP